MPAALHDSAVFYEERGTGDPPMVFVHGLGTHEHFASQIEHFARDHRVIAPDLPGYGRSAPPPDASIAGLATELARLCDELLVRDAVVVGHSMSGAIALEVAAARPDLVSALVLLEPIPIAPVPLFQERMTPFVQVLKTPGYQEAIRGFAERLMFRPADDPAIRARVVDDMCAQPQDVVAQTMASIPAWNGETVASRVHVPVLLVQAADGIPSDIPRTQEIIPQLELGRVVGAGHFAHLIVPDQVNAMIERFLAVSF